MRTTDPVAGKEWIAESRFSPLSDRETSLKLLSMVRARAAAAGSGNGKPPVVIFDLDYTVYDNDPRMHRVLQEWAVTADAQSKFPEAAKAIGGLPLENVQYLVGDCVREAGVDEQQAAAVTKALLPFFLSKFFENEHTLIDPTIPGATDLIRELSNAGARIVYLTGRTEAEQGAGTRAALARDGLEVDNERFFLFLKPSNKKADGSNFSDEEFKRLAGKEIEKIGDVVGTLDNEPANVIIFSDLFPKAMNCFVNTRWSNKKAEPGNGLFKIDRFVSPKTRSAVPMVQVEAAEALREPTETNGSAQRPPADGRSPAVPAPPIELTVTEKHEPRSDPTSGTGPRLPGVDSDTPPPSLDVQAIWATLDRGLSATLTPTQLDALKWAFSRPAASRGASNVEHIMAVAGSGEWTPDNILEAMVTDHMWKNRSADELRDEPCVALAKLPDDPASKVSEVTVAGGPRLRILEEGAPGKTGARGPMLAILGHGYQLPEHVFDVVTRFYRDAGLSAADLREKQQMMYEAALAHHVTGFAASQVHAVGLRPDFALLEEEGAIRPGTAEVLAQLWDCSARAYGRYFVPLKTAIQQAAAATPRQRDTAAEALRQARADLESDCDVVNLRQVIGQLRTVHPHMYRQLIQDDLGQFLPSQRLDGIDSVSKWMEEMLKSSPFDGPSPTTHQGLISKLFNMPVAGYIATALVRGKGETDAFLATTDRLAKELGMARAPGQLWYVPAPEGHENHDILARKLRASGLSVGSFRNAPIAAATAGLTDGRILDEATARQHTAAPFVRLARGGAWPSP